MIKFPYDADKARNVTQWLLKRHVQLDHIKVLKLVVLADLEHLARYGRPIVGGPYFALEHGPVASELYDDLKLGASGGLGTEAISVGSYVVRSLAELDEDYLSESDLEVLSEIEAKYGAWDSYRLSKLTHSLDAWKKNYKGNNGSYRIPYEDFVQEKLDETARSLLADDQEAERVLG